MSSINLMRDLVEEKNVPKKDNSYVCYDRMLAYEFERLDETAFD